MTIIKKPRPKRCRNINCGKKFTPRFRTTQIVCSSPCARAYAEQQREKQFKKELKVRKELMKTRSEWLDEVQQVFNKYIRLRDKHEPCISCQRHDVVQFQAGHFRTIGAHPELRFHELNVHKQCSQCNDYHSGNLIEYRKNLEKKIGKEAVAWLEGPHLLPRYTIEDLKKLKAYYKDKIKELEQQAA